MGRTVPTFRHVIESFGLDWVDFKRALRRIDQEAFESLLNHARNHAAAGTNMVNPNPFEPIVMAMLVEHEKTLKQLKERLDMECAGDG
ncbi:MAG: hypothetical protein KKC68_09350 [Candidatus Thermoplasmatota archaeon]|nr:hypothetical protein [Candidatus Thermoplasmatota archaeon]MBU1941964.1 hypothetical protein [Candidatus Thermoplasmatota archaeon]